MANEVKKFVTERIADLLDHESFAGSKCPENVVEVTVSHPTSLQTQIRVKTKDEGTHYFLVRVSEAV